MGENGNKINHHVYTVEQNAWLKNNQGSDITSTVQRTTVFIIYTAHKEQCTFFARRVL